MAYPISDGVPQSAAATVATYEQTTWQISVDGQKIKRILSFKLEQSFGAHHAFDLRLYHTELEDPRAYRIDKSKELLGKRLTVILGTQLTADINRFAGIITEVGFEEANGMYGVVVLKGYSPTILLESGPHMRSFYNRNLSGIAGDITGTVKGKLDVSVKPRFSGNIEYSVQHKESHFQFLNRLSAAWGEWFYYDGEKLNFGRPASQPTFDLQYVRHLQNLQMNLQVVPMSFTHLSYRAEDDQVLTKEAPQRVDGLDYYGDLAVQQSAQVYSAVKNTPWQHATDAGALDAAAKVNKSAAAAQTFAITAESRHPAPRPGARIRIMFSDTELGEYVVTEAVHNLDNVNMYSCVFKALPAAIEVMPVPAELHIPHSGAQLATVMENADPAGIGRVRVQFSWQEEDSRTPWLRVLSPDAGSSGVVSKNRGFVFVPEVGDSVLVDFEGGNPDAPFVLGSVFHGKNGAGGGAENITKSISTRSGHTVELSDKGEGTHIIIRDPGGNEIYLDTVGKNITITAPETMTFNANNVVVNAKQNITLNAGENIAESAGKHVSIQAGQTITESAGADYMLQAQNITKVAVQNISSSSDTHKQQAVKEIMAQSTEGTIFHEAQKEVKSNSGDSSNLH